MKAAKRPPILRTSAATLVALLAAGAISAHATTYIWTGASNNIWDNSSNWNPSVDPHTDPIPPDLVFAGSHNTNTVNNTSFFVKSITFNQDAASFSLNNAFIAMYGGSTITNNSANLQTIAFTGVPGFFGGLSLFDFGGSTTTVNAAAGDIRITSDITFNAPVKFVVTGPHNTLISGSISDVGTPAFNGMLIKEGTGTLFLTGNNTFPGNTIVNGGRLQVDGNLGSLQTYVNPGGTLAGIGRLAGTVYNSGIVAPGDGVGTLSIGRNYVQNKDGQLTIEINGSKSHDLLAVGGRADLGGTLRIVNTGKGSLLKPGQTIDILTAGGGVHGTFDNTDHGNTIALTSVTYTSNAVEVRGLADPFGSYAQNAGLTENQISVARGLDKIAFRNTQPKLINFLVNEPLSNLPGDFDRIAPEELTSIFTIGVALANVQTANLQRRTDDIRAGSHGFSAAGFAAAGSGPLYSGGVAGPNGNDGKESKEVKNVVPPENRWGVFITGVGEWVNVSGDNNARGYDVTTGGFTVGADYKVTPNFAVGLSAGYAGTESDLTKGGRVRVNGGKLGLYATYFTGGGFYVDTAVTGGYNSYDTHRAALQGTARGDTDGGELNVLFATGYDFKSGNFSFGPTASFQYTYLGISDYNEHGSLAPLTFRSQHEESLRTAFGLRASYDWKVGGVIIRPEVRAAWQHEYGDDRYSIDSSFGGGNGNLFTVTGPRLGRDSLLVGAGFAILWNDRVSTYVYYDGELGRENYEAQNVSGGVRVSF